LFMTVNQRVAGSSPAWGAVSNTKSLDTQQYRGFFVCYY
jgi:hypothetical protein